LPGEHTSRFAGLGVEYESVREYQYGDDERRIDWNITARTPPKPDGERTLFIKQFREERNLDVLLVIDQSGSMEYKDKVLTAVRAALVIADMAQRRSDYVGLVCFRDKVEVFLPPTRSNEQAYRILRTLCMSYRTGGASHLKTMAVELIRGLRRRTIVNLITDINHEVDEYVYFSHLLRTRGHVTNLLLIADESELNLPDVGWLTLMESEELRRITIDTSEFKTEYDTEVHSVLTGIMSGCKMFGTKIFLFKNPREVDYKITEIADYYRLAREYAYR
jgi:uncharacterized protein (DUF58 family)